MRLSKITYFFLVPTIISLFSCTGNLRYLKNKEASHEDTIMYQKNLPANYTLQPGDVLSVRIYTYNENINELMRTGSNQARSGNNQNADNMYYSGYVLDDYGFIELPILGKIHLAGQSLNQSRQTLKEKAEEYFDNPVTVVKSAGIQFACLGEFNSQGVVTVAREKVDIFDALSYAGGLSEYADKKNIKIIRNRKGRYEEYLVDLTSPELLSKKRLFVFNNDKIIADPVPAKIIRRNIQEFTFILSVISSTVTTTVLLINLQNK